MVQQDVQSCVHTAKAYVMQAEPPDTIGNNLASSSIWQNLSVVKVKVRQKALSGLEAQVSELTQQLHESDQSRVQLEQQLESERGTHADEAAKSQVSCVSQLRPLYHFGYSFQPIDHCCSLSLCRSSTISAFCSSLALHYSSSSLLLV